MTKGATFGRYHSEPKDTLNYLEVNWENQNPVLCNCRKWLWACGSKAMQNVQVSKLGVTSVLVSTGDGVCLRSFEEGMAAYARNKGKSRNSR
jgi:hypothetical protein